jgi:hypothetical protein
MASDDAADRRLKFYGLGDYGTFFQVECAAEVLDSLDAFTASHSIPDVIELHDVYLFVESNLFPGTFPDSQREASRALLPKLKAAVARYFNALDDANLVDAVSDGVGATSRSTTTSFSRSSPSSPGVRACG